MGSTTVRAAELDRYLVIAWRGISSCPIGLRDVKTSERDDHPVPLVFSSEEPPSICVTLKKHDDGQYVIAVREQPYPQIVFRNLGPTALTVTDGPDQAEPTIRLIASDWHWPYVLMPGGTSSYLSFPYATFVNGVTLFLVIVTDGSSRPGTYNI